MASQAIKLSESVMKEACEESWKQVNKNQAILNAHSVQCKPAGDAQNAISVISEMKAKCLRGEIDAVKARDIQVLPTDPVVLESLLKEQLTTTVSQLEECRAVVEGRRKELDDDLIRQDELLTQHQEMNRALASRLRDAEQNGNKNTPSEDSQIKALKRKQKKAGEIQTQLLKQIADFVSKHYPMPTQGDDHRYSSLLEVIELLMNQGMDSELDPYVVINEAFWPPYVELLLRCGIASRHPQDTNRIRLVPLHL